jgi:DNA-binding IclR family transcriptional regulator
MVAEQATGNSIKSLERAFDIFSTLQDQQPLTLTELSRALDLPTSTAHIYLKTLERSGFIVKEGRQYYNSLKFLEYGGHARQRYELFHASRHVMTELAIQTGERVGIGVEENGKRVMIAIRDGQNAISDNVPVGESTEMHWTGLGKCILAHLPADRREEIIESSELNDGRGFAASTCRFSSVMVKFLARSA